MARGQITAQWRHGPITEEQHGRWHRQPGTPWFWTVLEVFIEGIGPR